MEFHPIANIFPMMGEEELDQLADDIMENPLFQPIVMYEGKILDGRNRYRAFCDYCGADELPREFFEDIKIYPSGEPAVMDYVGDDPLGYVLSMNLHRRHLTASQRAALAAEIANMTQADAAHKTNYMLGRSPKIREAISQTEAAEKLDVSPAYIQQAKKIQRESPEHFDKVKSGELSLQQAKRELAPEPTTSTDEVNQLIEADPVLKKVLDRLEAGLPDTVIENPRAYLEPEPQSDIVVEFAGKRMNTLDDLMKVKTPDQKLLDQFFELDLAVIKVRKLVTELSAHPRPKIRSILYGCDEITRTLSYQATSLGESAQFYRELSNGEESTGSN